MQIIILLSLLIWSVINPTQNLAKFCVGFITLQIKRLKRMIICIRTIHPLLCPIFFVKKGI